MKRLVPALLAALLIPWGSTAHAGGVHRGKLEIHHRDDFRHGASSTTYRLVEGRRRRRLALRAAPRIPAGSRVVVRGRRVGSVIRGSVRRAGARASATAPALGPRATAVLLVNFSADTRQPWTADHVRQRVFTDTDSTNAFYREQSYDQVQIVGKERSDGDVYGWYTIDAPTAGCDFDQWATKARAAAAADGRDLSGYRHIVYAFPPQSSCSWAGLAELPGNESWLNGDLRVRIVAHELGHNMGIHHASSQSCTDGGAPATLGGACTTYEYGDPFDVMGNGSRHSHGWHLDKLGYLQPGNVRTITASGTYTVRSAISQSSEVQVLRIPRTRDASGAVIDYYYLELRSSGGVFDSFSAIDPVVNGVSVRVAPDRSVVTQSKLLDTTPGSLDGFGDAPLGVGRTFSDGAVSVTTRSISGLTATVDVTVPGGAAPAVDSSSPSAPRDVRAGWASGAVALAWESSVDDHGIARYAVLRDGVEIGSTVTPSYRDLAARPGSTHAYAVAAVDAAGNRSELSAPFVLEPDRTAPSIRILRPRKGSPAHGKVSIAASAADAVGVARMELRIDGRRRAMARGGRISFTWRMGRRARASHTIEVRAVDASGNVGRRSLRVSAARTARRR